MMQVWCYDINGFFIESIFVEEIGENMTKMPITVGFYKAKWNETEWIEGATDIEIEQWKVDNNVIKQPTEAERISALEEALLLML